MGARLATETRTEGRVEWCSSGVTPANVMPSTSRAFEGRLGFATPTPMTGGVTGPFTRWYPTGSVESHGTYVEEGAESLAHGVWGFWYENGRRRGIGRFERGTPVGCFALWDEQGNEATGVVDGEQLRVESCEPPSVAFFAQPESRSNPPGTRVQWGDVTFQASAQTGAFGASNPTQIDADPSARGALQATVRKYVGAFRVGPLLAWRLSDSDDVTAYAAGAVGAYGVDVPSLRLDVEVEAQLRLEYFDITARRPNVLGPGETSLWVPRAGVRLGGSVALSSALSLVASFTLERALTGSSEQSVQYCAPLCSPPIRETWDVGGNAYGASLGLRIRIK